MNIEWQLNVGEFLHNPCSERLRLRPAPDWPATPTGLAPDKGPEQHRCPRSLVIILHRRGLSLFQPHSLDRCQQNIPPHPPPPSHCIRAASTFSLFARIECGIVRLISASVEGRQPASTPPPPPSSHLTPSSSSPHLLPDLRRPPLPIGNTHFPLRSLHHFIANSII